MPSPGQHQALVPLTTGGTSGVSQLCFAFSQLFTEASTLHCVHSNPGMCLLESCRARALGPGIWQCLRQMSLTPRGAPKESKRHLCLPALASAPCVWFRGSFIRVSKVQPEDVQIPHCPQTRCCRCTTHPCWLCMG